jgi:hypothetical protein
MDPMSGALSSQTPGNVLYAKWKNALSLAVADSLVKEMVAADFKASEMSGR